MEQMNKFTLLNAAMRILSSKICLMKKRHEKYYNPLTSKHICCCLFSIFKQKYRVKGLYELPVCTKMCTKLARSVLC